ncbi:MAG: hypothetical protein II972_01280, partial [Elusimicrobiaceae bacterium]|nr:hypothetical protein [Elusimicrobiaceae bacterium]
MKKFLSFFLFLVCANFAFAQEVSLEEQNKLSEQKEIAPFATFQEPAKKVSFATPFDLTIKLDKAATFEPEEES